MVGSFVGWYSDFVSKKVSVPQNGIVYSVARKSFVSKTGSAVKAELFTDFVELKSLCNLIGPYGVKLIDREILKFVLSSVNTMKDYVSHNRQALDEIRLNYYNETICNESLKKIKGKKFTGINKLNKF
jgi:NCK-associated protein 1